MAGTYLNSDVASAVREDLVVQLVRRNARSDQSVRAIALSQFSRFGTFLFSSRRPHIRHRV